MTNFADVEITDELIEKHMKVTGISDKNRAFHILCTIKAADIVQRMEKNEKEAKDD